MPFRYRQLLDVSESGKDVHCISFSKNGDYVVLGTDNCITVWDIDAGIRFEPDLKTADPLSITWINESSFVVGYRNGSLYTFTLILEEQRLELSGFVASQQPILHLSSNASGTELASAGLTEVGIWVKTKSQEGTLHWQLRNTLPSPSPYVHSLPLRPIYIAWFPTEPLKELLVLYERQVIIWDTNTLSARKTFNIPGPVTSAALSDMGTIFMVATQPDRLQIWDVLKGIPVSSNPWTSKSRSSIRFIHGGHALLVGRHACADILEPTSMSRIQTLWLIEKRQVFSVQNMAQSLSRRIIGRDHGKELVDILGDYCRDADGRYLIATASSSRAVIWKGDESSAASDTDALQERPGFFTQLCYMHFFFLAAIVIGFMLGTLVERKKIVFHINE